MASPPGLILAAGIDAEAQIIVSGQRVRATPTSRPTGLRSSVKSE
jgi:hypothetical protein